MEKPRPNDDSTIEPIGNLTSNLITEQSSTLPLQNPLVTLFTK